MTDAKLKSYVERIEKLIEERDGIAGDIRDVFAEAEGVGYDKAALRRIVAWRALDAGEQDAREYLDDCYLAALEGRHPNLPADGPRDPELAKAVALFRDGKTVRDVKEALKISLGKAAKLHARAKPFLDAVRKPGRPSANVHAELNIAEARP